MFPQTNQDASLAPTGAMPTEPVSGQATMPLPIAGSGGYYQPSHPTSVPVASMQNPGQAISPMAPPIGGPAMQPGAISLPQAPVTASVPVLQPTVPVHPVSPSDAPVDSQVAAADLPAEAADGDVIETEWVNKAKLIVEETRLNPHMQVRKMNILKAEYMKKRYDKDIKFPGV